MTTYLVDVAGKFLQRILDEPLLGVRELSKWLDTDNTFGLVKLIRTIIGNGSSSRTHSEFYWCRKIIDIFADGLLESVASSFVSCQIDVARCNDALLALNSPEDFGGEFSTGIGHRKGSRACAILGLDDFVTTELNSLDEGIVLLLRNLW